MEKDKECKTYTIDFYDKYECIGADCPYTCCKGWQIAVDDKTYREYRAASFPKNLKLMGFTRIKEGGIRCIRKINGACPFYSREGWCSFQKNGEENLVPEVCRAYPRSCISFGDYKEVTLELSCIRVAELFVENILPHDFYEYSNDVNAFWEMGNDSKNFLEFLNESRGIILNYLWRADDYEKAVYDIYEYIYAVNHLVSLDKLDQLESKTGAPGDGKIKSNFIIPKISRMDDCAPFYPIWFVNEIIYERFSHSRLKKSNRFLYDLVNDYKKLFGDLTEKQADFDIRRKLDEMLEAQPELNDFFRVYFSYLIQQTYCKSYEDYYVLGPVLLAIMDLQLVMIFVLTHFMKHGNRIELADLAAVLANTERGIRHNLTLNDDILFKIRKQFF